MSKGLGRIQRECLRVIDAYEVVGREPTTYNIVAKVYQVKRNERGVLVINEAQHTAVKRALANLRRRGLIVGMQDVGVTDDGRDTFTVRVLAVEWNGAASGHSFGARGRKPRLRQQIHHRSRTPSSRLRSASAVRL
jgi:hypothetical protein